MLYPRYVNGFTDITKMHEIETVDTMNIINEIIPKFYDYIVAAELSENPYTAPPAATTNNCYLNFNEDNVGEPRDSSRGGNILR